MGKKIIGVIAFAAIAAAGWNYQQNKNYHLFPCPSSSGNECRFKDSERPECYGPTYCR